MRYKLFAGLILSAGFLAGLVLSGRMSLSESGFTAPAPPGAQTPSRPGMPASGPLPDLSTIAERALKVSVNITSTSVTVVDDPWTRLVYGRDIAQRSQSLGSGVVVSADGTSSPTRTHLNGR